MSEQKAVWKPHPGFQWEFCRRPEFEVFGGGAAGPGKTDSLVAMALRYVSHPRYRGIIFRRSFPQLGEIIDRMRRLYPKAVPGAEWSESRKRWTFPSGAQVRLGHMLHEGDKYDYQGDEFQFIGFDELTHFTESQYLYMFSRCRRTEDFPFPPMIRATSNPGGIGHAFVKRRFRIGLHEPGQTIWEEITDKEIGSSYWVSRVFIPGYIEDNPSLNAEEYMSNLAHLSPIERMRLRHGIWDAFEGQVFSELNRDLHGFDYDVPTEWLDTCFGSFDWGSSKPWSYGLWVTDPEGGLWRFAELFGGKQDDRGEYLDEGLKQTEPEIARQILEMEAAYHVKPRLRVADPSIWSPKGTKGQIRGPSVAEQMMREGVTFVKGDNDRIAGRRQMHLRLELEDGQPGLHVHSRCKAWWQTIPLLTESEKNPEDVEDKDAPDHCYDETRYALMSRPIKPKQAHLGVPVHSFQWERKKLIRANKVRERGRRAYG